MGLQVEAAGKMKVAAGVLDHRTIQNCVSKFSRLRINLRRPG